MFLAVLFTSTLIATSGITTDTFPYQASLHSATHFLCSGALISPKWVLTSASCALGNPKIVRVGSSDFRTGGQISTINFIRTHPEYYPKRLFANDIALVALSKKILFDSRVKVIKMATHEPDVGSQLYAIGWGPHANSPKYPWNLLSALHPVIADPNACNATVYQLSRHNISEDIICTGGNGRGFCQDNLGSVLATSDGFLYGIATWTQICRKTLNFDLFVSVVYHKDFISQTLQQIQPI